MSVRRVEAAPAVAPTLPNPDFASAFEMPRPHGDPRSPQRWMRDVWEGAPAALRPLLRTGWRLGLGLHLGPLASPTHILGWQITSSTPDATTVEARSRLLTAANVVEVTDAHVRWSTVVRFDHRLARPLWSLAAPVHHRLIPALLRRAAKAALPPE